MTRSKQTRKSISIRGLVHQRIEAHCSQTGETVAGFIEDIISAKFGEPTEEDRRKFAEKKGKSDKGSEATPKAEEQPYDQVASSTTQPIKVTLKSSVKKKNNHQVEFIPEEDALPRHRPFSKGTPIELRKRNPETLPEGFEDYVPPNLEF